jgi:hypothetical protein
MFVSSKLSVVWLWRRVIKLSHRERQERLLICRFVSSETTSTGPKSSVLQDQPNQQNGDHPSRASVRFSDSVNKFRSTSTPSASPQPLSSSAASVNSAASFRPSFQQQLQKQHQQPHVLNRSPTPQQPSQNVAKSSFSFKDSLKRVVSPNNNTSVPFVSAPTTPASVLSSSPVSSSSSSSIPSFQQSLQSSAQTQSKVSSLSSESPSSPSSRSPPSQERTASFERFFAEIKTPPPTPSNKFAEAFTGTQARKPAKLNFSSPPFSSAPVPVAPPPPSSSSFSSSSTSSSSASASTASSSEATIPDVSVIRDIDRPSRPVSPFATSFGSTGLSSSSLLPSSSSSFASSFTAAAERVKAASSLPSRSSSDSEDEENVLRLNREQMEEMDPLDLVKKGGLKLFIDSQMGLLGDESTEEDGDEDIYSDGEDEGNLDSESDGWSDGSELDGNGWETSKIDDEGYGICSFFFFFFLSLFLSFFLFLL